MNISFEILKQRISSKKPRIEDLNWINEQLKLIPKDKNYIMEMLNLMHWEMYYLWIISSNNFNTITKLNYFEQMFLEYTTHYLNNYVTYNFDDSSINKLLAYLLIHKKLKINDARIRNIIILLLTNRPVNSIYFDYQEFLYAYINEEWKNCAYPELEEQLGKFIQEYQNNNFFSIIKLNEQNFRNVYFGNEVFLIN